MERAAVRRRDRLILEARDEIRQLGRTPTAADIDAKVLLKDPALHGRWKSAQDAAHRRKTILQVLRDEGRPKAPHASRAELGAQEPKPRPPPLVWPRGMRWRKKHDPKFKLPWPYRDSGGSERVFLECLGERNLHEVSVVLKGQQIGFVPALRPGTFLDIEWQQNPEVKRIATWGGWRGRILAQPLNRDAVGTLKGFHVEDSDLTKLGRSLAEIAQASVAEVEKVMPADFEGWKHHVHEFPLSVGYRLGDGNAVGGLSGTLSLDMERLWFRFRDDRGNETPIL